MTDKRKVPEWRLERYALEELSRAEMSEIQADPESAVRVEALHESDREILASYPSQDVAAEVARRARSCPRKAIPSFRMWMPVMGFAAATALIVLLHPNPTGVTEHVAEYVGVKGTAHLVAYKSANGRPQRIDDGSVARSKERVQLRYLAAGRRYGVIVSLDGRGGVTLHWPESGEASPPLEQGGEVTLPHAFELDDAPGFERFVLVTAQEPIAVQRVLEAARAIAGKPQARDRALVLPVGWDQSGLLLRKEAP
jgi:hypothetical protein